MTAIEDVYKYLLRRKELSTGETVDHFSNKYAYSTVADALSRLVQLEIADRVSRGRYVLAGEEIFFRHYLSALAYCGGKKIQFYALTFDVNDLDREEELFNAIIEETFDSCGNWDDTGYEITESNEGMDSGNSYPEIEVGRL